MTKKLCFASLLLCLPLAAQSSQPGSAAPIFSGHLVTIPDVKPLSGTPATGAAPQSSDAPWTSKRIADWTEKDSFTLLTESPWAKMTPALLTRLLSQYQRRDGGDFNAQGGGHGGVAPTAGQALFGTGGAMKKPGETGPEAQHLKVMIRWESAMPVQAAELRTHNPNAPELDGEDYAITVYNLDLKLASLEDWRDIEKGLQRVALLKIEGRTEVRPTRVAFIQTSNETANVVYFFPRSAHITAADQRVEFDGQVGRIVFAQYFYPSEMKLFGKLEL